MIRTAMRKTCSLLPLTLLAAAACNSTPGSTQSAPPQTATAGTTATTDPTTAKAPPAPDPETHAKLVAALQNAARTPEEKARDKFRHPIETLEFFGLKDTMNVVEISPGGGWYSVLLGPVLLEKGHWSATTSDPNGPADKESTKRAIKYRDRLGANPALFGPHPDLRVVSMPDSFNLGPDGSADMVVTFRNIHNYLGEEGADGGANDSEFNILVTAIMKVLKPGGILGIEEHRAKKGADWKEAAKTGYTPTEWLKGALAKAGFQFVAESEINANPSDTKDYDEGVWALPPSFARKGDKDHDKLAAIGESDRMTLTFRKPAK